MSFNNHTQNVEARLNSRTRQMWKWAISQAYLDGNAIEKYGLQIFISHTKKSVSHCLRNQVHYNLGSERSMSSRQLTDNKKHDVYKWSEYKSFQESTIIGAYTSKNWEDICDGLVAHELAHVLQHAMGYFFKHSVPDEGWKSQYPNLADLNWRGHKSGFKYFYALLRKQFVNDSSTIISFGRDVIHKDRRSTCKRHIPELVPMKGLYNQDWIKRMGKQNNPYIHKCKVCGKVKQIRNYFPKFLQDELVYNGSLSDYTYDYLISNAKKWVEWNKHPKAGIEYRSIDALLEWYDVDIPEDKQNAAIISAERS